MKLDMRFAVVVLFICTLMSLHGAYRLGRVMEKHSVESLRADDLASPKSGQHWEVLHCGPDEDETLFAVDDYNPGFIDLHCHSDKNQHIEIDLIDE